MTAIAAMPAEAAAAVTAVPAEAAAAVTAAMPAEAPTAIGAVPAEAAAAVAAMTASRMSETRMSEILGRGWVRGRSETQTDGENRQAGAKKQF